jgi:hypothetical protein
MPLPKVTLPTNDELIDFLKGQDPDGEYVWQDPVYCLMGRYFSAKGQSGWGETIYSDMPNYDAIAGQKPWTFGAALVRAEALKQLPPPAALIEYAKTDTLTKSA